MEKTTIDANELVQFSGEEMEEFFANISSQSVVECTLFNEAEKINNSTYISHSDSQNKGVDDSESSLPPNNEKLFHPSHSFFQLRLSSDIIDSLIAKHIRNDNKTTSEDEVQRFLSM